MLAGASGFEAQGMDPMEGTCAPAGSGGAAGEGPGAAEERWRFSLRGLLHALTVEQFKQAVGCILDRDTVDRLVGSGAFEGPCLLQQPLGCLPAGVRAQLLDPAAPARLAEALQMLQAMGLITAEGCERGARAGGPPAAAPTYVASALIQLEEPEDLSHPTLYGEPLDMLVPAADRARRPPPEAQLSPEDLARGGFRRRQRGYDLRRAGGADLYWGRLELMCTLWREKMAFCFPATWEPGAVSRTGWSYARPLGREEALDLEAFLQQRLETLNVVRCYKIARELALPYPTARRTAHRAFTLCVAAADSPFCFLHLREHALKQRSCKQVFGEQSAAPLCTT